jgi:hypothetical protein
VYRRGLGPITPGEIHYPAYSVPDCKNTPELSRINAHQSLAGWFLKQVVLHRASAVFRSQSVTKHLYEFHKNRPFVKITKIYGFFEKEPDTVPVLHCRTPVGARKGAPVTSDHKRCNFSVYRGQSSSPILSEICFPCDPFQ